MEKKNKCVCFIKIIQNKTVILSYWLSIYRMYNCIYLYISISLKRFKPEKKNTCSVISFPSKQGRLGIFGYLCQISEDTTTPHVWHLTACSVSPDLTNTSGLQAEPHDAFIVVLDLIQRLVFQDIWMLVVGYGWIWLDIKKRC